MTTDPTDDKTYENLSLEDFVRHLAPQVARQREEILDINQKGFAPLYDPMYKETAPPEEKKELSRQERRRLELVARRKERRKTGGNGKRK